MIWLYKNVFKTNNYSPFFVLKMKHLWFITHTKPCKYTWQEDGGAAAACSLLSWTDVWWEACTAKRLRPNAQKTVSHKITAELNQLSTSSAAGLHLSQVNITVKYHMWCVSIVREASWEWSVGWPAPLPGVQTGKTWLYLEEERISQSS